VNLSVDLVCESNKLSFILYDEVIISSVTACTICLCVI
jgi:hypothetical protein